MARRAGAEGGISGLTRQEGMTGHRGSTMPRLRGPLAPSAITWTGRITSGGRCAAPEGMGPPGPSFLHANVSCV